jgi:hypothetical protein
MKTSQTVTRLALRFIPIKKLVLVVGTTFLIAAGHAEGAEASAIANQELADKVMKQIGTPRGICVVLGDGKGELALQMAQESELLLYLQLPDAKTVETVRRIVDARGFYGDRIYVEAGPLARLHLADNLADALVAVGDGAAVPESEALRVLRPQGKAWLGKREILKPFPAGIDDWSHPYHGPDNNPASKDQIAKGPYLTHFLADPRYAPLPSWPWPPPAGSSRFSGTLRLRNEKSRG